MPWPAAHEGVAKIAWAVDKGKAGGLSAADAEGKAEGKAGCQAEAKVTSTAFEIAAEAASSAFKVMAAWSRKRSSVEAGRNRGAVV